MSIAVNLSRALLATSALLSTYLAAEEVAVLHEVVVSASRFREESLIDVPASVTVLDERLLLDSAQQHFEEVLTQIPNLNWASGSSRPRYFQIRGIGEREQYEGAPNSSVGFLIDDIDFSGVGMAGTLFDIEQIEVLRGPQGTRLGANALAGLIAMRSAEPEDTFGGRAVADVGNYDTGSIGLSATGPVEALNSAWRLSVQKYRSDGFRTNTYLNRDDTNGRDELTARAKWRWKAGERGQLDVTYLHVNLDNGYDAFAIDNSRTTLSDSPGQDSQAADAVAVKWRNEFSGGMALTAVATALDSDSIHAYDGDWGNPQSWFPYDYDFLYRAERGRSAQTLELRLNSAAAESNGDVAWLAGVYAQRLREHIHEYSFSASFGLDDFLDSHYQATNAALFAQLDGRFATRWVWSGGLRAEKRAADYEDAGVWNGDSNRTTQDSASDEMLGGQVSLTLETGTVRSFVAISRGYKAGGFNFGQARDVQAQFAPEYLWNFEVGAKGSWLEGAVFADATVFYMQRQDMQVRSGTQLDPGNPNSFGFVTQNVADGQNYGVEASLRWLPFRSLEVGASVGLLRTEQSGALREDGTAVPPREQAHAPSYQLQANITYRHLRGFMARIDGATVDSFYFDVPTDHDQRSDTYLLVNVKVGYELERWRFYAWARNAFDELYATRGFYFGNEPPDYNDKLYIQNGDPRTYGVSVEWSLR